MPDNYEYVGDKFQTQDAIRTIHFSFQPHLPFTAAYSMALQNAGGGKLTQDPGKKAYFRLAPKDIKGSSNPKSLSNDRKYPWESGHPLSRRDIFRGIGSGRLTKMAQSQNRQENTLRQLPNTGPPTSFMGGQLAALLNVDYKTKNPIFTPESSRDATEMELKMIAEGFDNIAKVQGGQGQDLNKKFEPTYTDRTGRGFDIDLTKYNTLSSYIESVMKDGVQYSDLEITKAENKVLGTFKGQEKITQKNKKVWENHIDNKFAKYNATIREAYANSEATLESGLMPSKALVGGQSFEYARTLATTPGGDSSSDNYNIRQILDRFARNNMKPYLFQAQFSSDRWGLTVITPQLENGIPQFSRGTTAVITTSKDMMTGYTRHVSNLKTTDSKKVAAEVTKVKRIIRETAVLTRARIETLGKYANALTQINADGQIETYLSTDGPDQVHKIQMKVAKKLKDDIDAYFNSAPMQGRFKEFYNNLIVVSNQLTKAWFRNSAAIVGKVTGEPISEEFKYGQAWDGPRKKYLGVWSSPTENTWKGDGMGYNFSVAPVLESRRDLSSNLNIKSTYEIQE
jgi:hypothetical protein|tara:strand:+ start:2715 stop:4421 length:1707 start_codon:yes stop_codon:yes gene_type:complete